MSSEPSTGRIIKGWGITSKIKIGIKIKIKIKIKIRIRE